MSGSTPLKYDFKGDVKAKKIATPVKPSGRAQTPKEKPTSPTPPPITEEPKKTVNEWQSKLDFALDSFSSAFDFGHGDIRKPAKSNGSSKEPKPETPAVDKVPEDGKALGNQDTSTSVSYSRVFHITDDPNIASRQMYLES